MPRLTVEEHAADLAEARVAGAKQIADLIKSMRELGLSLAAVNGALSATINELATEALELRAKAEASRAPKTEPEPQTPLS